MHKENCPPCDFESGVCLSPDALRTLIRYPWPGNVRELENLIKQLKVLCGSGGITQYDLPEYFLQTGNSNSGTLLFNNDGAPYSQARAKVLEEFNRSIITKALRETEGNISKASKNLQTPKSNILRLMKKYEIQSKGN
jgi:DNA-binding NtrC family response regulator